MTDLVSSILYPASLILLIGLPGSGKTTLAQQLITQRPDYRLVSTDRIRAQLFGDEATQGPWLQVWREVQRQFQRSLTEMLQGQAFGVIYDATNAARKQRRRVVQLARGVGFSHISYVWLDTPLALCLERNQKRDRQVPEEIILQMQRQLLGAPPGLGEGCDRLIRLGAEIAISTAQRTEPDLPNVFDTLNSRPGKEYTS